MGSMNFQSKFQVAPPDKGSFPLDHEGECKQFMLKYMICLGRNDNDNALCRVEAKDYLGCRMEHDLMARESWKKLGFAEQEDNSSNNKTNS